MTPFSVFSRRFTANVALPAPYLSDTGCMSFRLAPMTATRSSLSFFVYASTFAASSLVSGYMSIRFSRITGPQCVCDALRMSSSRLMPCAVMTSAATSSPSVRGMPMRSVVTSTSRLPAESSRHSAFA